MTPISRNADLYLPVRPGTDLALFMGILHVILRDGLENRTFIDSHTLGFDKVEESAQPWTPAKAAGISGVPHEAIEKAARWFATCKRGFAPRRGIEHQSAGWKASCADQHCLQPETSAAKAPAA
jgi:assimilatory nitrate reductase catalytic subunit